MNQYKKKDMRDRCLYGYFLEKVFGMDCEDELERMTVPNDEYSIYDIIHRNSAIELKCLEDGKRLDSYAQYVIDAYKIDGLKKLIKDKVFPKSRVVVFYPLDNKVMVININAISFNCVNNCDYVRKVTKLCPKNSEDKNTKIKKEVYEFQHHLPKLCRCVQYYDVPGLSDEYHRLNSDFDI